VEDVADKPNMESRRPVGSGSDPRVRNPTGLPDLHIQLRRLNRRDEFNTRRTVMELLQYGFDPKTKDQNDETALHILAKNGERFNFDDFVDMFLSFINEVEREAYINAKDAKGKTALHYAIVTGAQWKTIKLLQLAANPLQDDLAGLSILHRFLVRLHAGGQDESLRVFTSLLELGCDPYAQNENGETALHLLATMVPCLIFPDSWRFCSLFLI